MPVGRWETFGQCVAAQRKKGYNEEQARRICGHIQKQSHKAQGKK